MLLQKLQYTHSQTTPTHITQLVVLGGGGAQWPEREETVQHLFVCNDNTFSYFQKNNIVIL